MKEYKKKLGGGFLLKREKLIFFYAISSNHNLTVISFPRSFA